MARTFMSYPVKVTATGVIQTLAQIVAATNTRCVIKGIELGPLGSTGASASLEFDLSIQDDAGGLTADSSAIVKLPPASGETLQTTTLKYNTNTEPTTSTPQQKFTLHQQGVRLWRPMGGEIIVIGGTRMGLRLITTGLGFAISVNFELEE